nr:hypothetical protein Itr_chr14CG12250 [Ipomoea trifida]
MTTPADEGAITPSLAAASPPPTPTISAVIGDRRLAVGRDCARWWRWVWQRGLVGLLLRRFRGKTASQL